jgi:hypothetical protein
MTFGMNWFEMDSSHIAGHMLIAGRRQVGYGDFNPLFPGDMI